MAINALQKALYTYEDKMEKQFIESEDLDVNDWIVYRGFVQNMNDIDKQVIMELPSIERHGKWLDGYGFAGNYFDCFICNQCKKENMAKTNYCPNCGVRMIKVGK